MKFLVTGAAGHLGEALVRMLRSEGADVRGTDIKSSPWCDQVGDLRDPGFVREVVSGRSHVIHTATLHKPHVATHSRQDFVDVNVSGTLNLLEAALESGVEGFVFSSTTSVFGEAMRLPEDAGEAVWVDETLAPIPRNIYGVTKRAAEDLCELFHRRHGLPAIILRTSRFFPEQDDDLDRRSAFGDDNLKANELLFRRGDIEDMATAHLCAARRAPELGFGRFIVSATTPFRRTDLAALLSDAPSVVERYFPGSGARYAAAGWRMFPTIGRVYDNGAARRALGWRPRFDFAQVLGALERGEPFGSDTARAVGKKGYHDAAFSEGPYPVDASAQAPRGDRVG
jgi:UDP-glucose 4-epimerase